MSSTNYPPFWAKKNIRQTALLAAGGLSKLKTKMATAQFHLFR